MFKHLFFAFSLTFSLHSSAQDYFDQFRQHLGPGDTLKQRELLNEWNQESPNEAELFVSYFNYYFLNSKTELLTINSTAPTNDNGEAFVIKDSADQIAGFIGTRIDYDQSNLKKAFLKIDAGIEAYPNRLDMRFGKVYALGEIQHWESFTSEIIKTINYSAKNKNEWTWTYNEEKEGGKEMFLSSLQTYIGQLYGTYNDDLMKNIRAISTAVLKHYPNHVESLSNLSISYIVEKDYKSAIPPLLEAEKIAPEDFIVLNNIAFAYKEIGNNKKAIEYYEKVLEFGDAQAKRQAEEILLELRN